MVPGPGWDMVRTMIVHCAQKGLASASQFKKSSRGASVLTDRYGDASGDGVALVGD